MSKQYSDEELLDDLERVAEELGESPTQEQYREHGEYSFQTVIDRFNTWNKAKEEAGLKTYSSSNEAKVSIEEVVEEIRNGKSLSEIGEKYGYASKHSGIQSLGNRLREHGFKVRSRLSKNKAAYSGDRFAGIISLSASLLDELGIHSVEEAYYDIEPFQNEDEKGVKITFHDSRIKEVDPEDRGESTVG